MSLKDLLKARIAAQGPMSLADYMAECLLHPDYGYYANRDPFGAAGDFITAPEISQMFGELLGLALAQYWLDLGQPKFTLAELGPGRGTLMADILRATARVPNFHAKAQIILVEASPKLEQIQAQKLASYRVTWAREVAKLPQKPLFLIANEFFDALAIRQFTRVNDGWAETMVGLSSEVLTLGKGPVAPLTALSQRLTDTPEGGIVETCAPAQAIAGQIGQRIHDHGGLALIIDYGDWRSLGDTFQALSAHRFSDPLATPGEADLTAHVDFEALAKAAAPAQSYFSTQGALLGALGLHARAERLAQSLQGKALETHLAAAKRLTAPEEMGTLFKVLALTAPNAPLPAGFAAKSAEVETANA